MQDVGPLHGDLLLGVLVVALFSAAVGLTMVILRILDRISAEKEAEWERLMSAARARMRVLVWQEFNKKRHASPLSMMEVLDLLEARLDEKEQERTQHVGANSHEQCAGRQ
ncbi:hypothetical protein [Nitrospira calida]|jgi:hypothetical protein